MIRPQVAAHRLYGRMGYLANAEPELDEEAKQKRSLLVVTDTKEDTVCKIKTE